MAYAPMMGGHGMHIEPSGHPVVVSIVSGHQQYPQQQYPQQQYPQQQYPQQQYPQQQYPQQQYLQQQYLQQQYLQQQPMVASTMGGQQVGGQPVILSFMANQPLVILSYLGGQRGFQHPVVLSTMGSQQPGFGGPQAMAMSISTQPQSANLMRQQMMMHDGQQVFQSEDQFTGEPRQPAPVLLDGVRPQQGSVLTRPPVAPGSTLRQPGAPGPLMASTQMLPAKPGPQILPAKPGPQILPAKPGPQVLPAKPGPQMSLSKPGPQMAPKMPSKNIR
ncbi:gamma-hordein-3-like [Varroa destructor]|uniref:Uncharacterized protein n=1 Tax=Varroa destructor TaxID=109461 RepID=A0A7M7KBI0_VARDE|nr:gamma-hordein-3-like [Varroa destructor]